MSTPDAAQPAPQAASPDAASPASTPAGKALDPRRVKRRRLFRLLAVLFVLVGGFVVGEVVVRMRYDIVDPRPYFNPGVYEHSPLPRSWTLRANYEGEYHQQTEKLKVSTNELGLRDPPLSDERRNAPKRFLMLGDSVTFGRGVADGEPFARGLERELGVVAFNTGVPGYDTRQELDVLQEFGPKLRPTHVIQQFYRNDVMVPSDRVKATIFEGHMADDEESFKRWKAKYIEHRGSPLEWSALIRFSRLQYKNFKMGAWTLDRRSRNPWTVDENDGGVKRCLQATKEIIAWCKANDARYLLVLSPAREEVERDGEVPNYRRLLKELCQAEKADFLDLSELWREHYKRTGQTLYLPRDRCHPNALGHAQIAKWIAAHLEESSGS